MIRAVLFDFEGTLVDFHRGSSRALFEAGAGRVYAYLTARGCALPAFEPFVRRQRALAWRIDWSTWLTGGEPDRRRLLGRLCDDYGLQRDEVSLSKLGWLWYEPVLETAEPLSADVIPTLRALRDAEVKLALVANTIHPGSVLDRHLDSLGLLEFFPVRAYSTELGSHKPHVHLFSWALQKLQVKPSAAVFVGDDVGADVVGARRCGMRSVLRTPKPALARAQADYVIERLGELLELLRIPPVHVARDPATPLVPVG